MAGLVGVEVPGGGEQGEAGDTARPARGKRHGKRATHAVSHHRRRTAGSPADEPGRTFEALDIGREVESTLLGIGRAPVDEVWPQAFGRHGAQQALLGGEIEHFPAIDQRRHHQHGARAAPAGGAMGGAVVEQARVALAPDGGRILEVAVDRMVAIGEHALGQATQPAADLAMEGSFETGAAAGRDFRQQVSERRAGFRVRRALLREPPRAF